MPTKKVFQMIAASTAAKKAVRKMSTKAIAKKLAKKVNAESPLTVMSLKCEISSEGVLNIFANNEEQTNALRSFWKRAADEGISATRAGTEMGVAYYQASFETDK